MATKKKRRSYETDPRKKIEEGKPWRITIVIDNANAKNILDEISASETGGNYQDTINNRLRKSYKSNPVKK